MQACKDWILIIFGTQFIKKKRPVQPVFPDYLSVSYDYAEKGCDQEFLVSIMITPQNYHIRNYYMFLFQ